MWETGPHKTQSSNPILHLIHLGTVCHLHYLSYVYMIGIISPIHKHCNIFSKMEIISLHLDISWIILFGEKGMHALLRDVNYWL